MAFEISYTTLNRKIAQNLHGMKYDRGSDSTAVEALVKFQSNKTIWSVSIAASQDCAITLR